MTFDLIVRGATLPDGRKEIDIAARGGRIAAIERRIIAADAAVVVDAQGRLVAALRRLPFPSRRDAVARPAAPQHLRHAARRHRAVGRVEAAADARGGRRAGAALLRSRRVARPARDPQPCRRLRRPAARRRGAARSQEAGQALSRPATRRLPAGRLFPFAQRGGAISSARSISASTSSAASRISSARWRTARRR